MGAAYSQDLRDRVLAASERGMKTKQIAEVFAVSPAWTRRINQRLREMGETTPRKAGSPGVRKIDRARLSELVEAQPDATAPELRARLGVRCSDAAIYKALKMMGYTFKKRRSMRPNRTAPMSPSAAPGGNANSPNATRAG